MAFNSELLDGMVIFVELIQAGSFTKSAQNMGHSTSYISKKINKLESRLGVRLLNRTTRSISLTHEGEIYFQQCLSIISDAQQAEACIHQQQQKPQGTLKISCSTSFGLSHLRFVLTKFMKTYPEINIELDISEKMVDVVADGFDVVIRATHTLQDSSLVSRKLLSSHGVTVASPEYLKKFGTPSHPNDLVDHQFIAYSNIKNPTSLTYHSLQGDKFTVAVKNRMLTNSSIMEVQLAVAGLGITSLPKFIVDEQLKTGQLVTILDAYQRTEINIYLVYASRKHMASKLRVFIDFMMQQLAS
ncbi:LysR family transcriptional regulator [Psychromonas hadalis]|uniref:LysR family transcriptional regulator n=1 Tax=Psychromonas hadalis TaxID=211669 RepID=UPI0003B63955|nr:LysR family transcriptional regulator [Psychromonas hadalis]